MGIEKFRYVNPPVPISDRKCQYCNSTYSNINQVPIDNEKHVFLCNKFQYSINCYNTRMSSLIHGYNSMSNHDKFVRCLCPANVREAKLTNKFIRFIFESRNKIDNDLPVYNVNFFQEQLL